MGAYFVLYFLWSIFLFLGPQFYFPFELKMDGVVHDEQSRSHKVRLFVFCTLTFFSYHTSSYR